MNNEFTEQQLKDLINEARENRHYNVANFWAEELAKLLAKQEEVEA